MLKRSLLVFVASLAQQQLKIGVYDNRKILESLPSVQEKFKKLTSEFEPKEKEISKRNFR